MHLQQLVSDGIAKFNHMRAGLKLQAFEENLTRQGVTIGVQPTGTEPNDDIPRANTFAIQHAGFLDDANDGPAYIILPSLVKPRHLSGFPANQRTTVGRATPG